MNVIELILTLCFSFQNVLCRNKNTRDFHQIPMFSLSCVNYLLFVYITRQKRSSVESLYKMSANYWKFIFLLLCYNCPIKTVLMIYLSLYCLLLHRVSQTQFGKFALIHSHYPYFISLEHVFLSSCWVITVKDGFSCIHLFNTRVGY